MDPHKIIKIQHIKDSINADSDYPSRASFNIKGFPDVTFIPSSLIRSGFRIITRLLFPAMSFGESDSKSLRIGQSERGRASR